MANRKKWLLGLNLTHPLKAHMQKVRLPAPTPPPRLLVSDYIMRVLNSSMDWCRLLGLCCWRIDFILDSFHFLSFPGHYEAGSLLRLTYCHEVPLHYSPIPVEHATTDLNFKTIAIINKKPPLNWFSLSVLVTVKYQVLLRIRNNLNSDENIKPHSPPGKQFLSVLWDPAHT